MCACSLAKRGPAEALLFDAQPAAEHEMRISRWLPFEGTSRTSNGQSDRLGCDTMRLELALHVSTACEHEVWLTNGASNANTESNRGPNAVERGSRPASRSCRRAARRFPQWVKASTQAGK